jgi:predicted 3-demethylubiquinone-9 3-methyltransferase (glyoxalase superfamily)
LQTTRYGDAGPGPKGSVMTISFQLFGLTFTALNGGPHFKFNESISFVINCENQDEIDSYWNALTKGGAESQCGWLKDKFGLSWQIVPAALPKLLANPDPTKNQRVMTAMLKMKKMILADLENAGK